MSNTHYDGLLGDSNVQSLFDSDNDQFSNWDLGNTDPTVAFDSGLADATGGIFSLSDAPTFGSLDLAVAPTASSLHFEDFGCLTADANAGGKPGGGGGGGGGKPSSGGGGGGATTYISGDLSHSGDAFNLQINFDGTLNASEQAVVKWAADKISSIITSDLIDDTSTDGTTPVDDIEINVSVGNIDRGGKLFSGNVLAQTTVLTVRDVTYTDSNGGVHQNSDAYLPVTTSMKLDSYDLKSSALSDAWDSIILHEMMHAVGFFGYVLDKRDLTDVVNNLYTGTNALAAYNAGSTGSAATGIALSADGGTLADGTKFSGSHWADGSFAPGGTLMSNELMTSVITSYTEPMPLSDVTVGLLQDLGYQILDPSPGSSSIVLDSGMSILA